MNGCVWPNPRILVVEDEVVTQQILLATLSRLGMSVTVCENAAIALYQYIQNTRFDAVILDMKMPGVDGEAFLTVAESLLDAGLMFSRPCIIVHTSVSNLDQLKTYSDFRCVHSVLSKPVQRTELVRHLDEILGQKLGKDQQSEKGTYSRYQKS